VPITGSSTSLTVLLHYFVVKITAKIFTPTIKINLFSLKLNKSYQNSDDKRCITMSVSIAN